jgi:hypothetical protein
LGVESVAVAGEIGTWDAVEVDVVGVQAVIAEKDAGEDRAWESRGVRAGWVVDLTVVR